LCSGQTPGGLGGGEPRKDIQKRTQKKGQHEGKPYIDSPPFGTREPLERGTPLSGKGDWVQDGR